MAYETLIGFRYLRTRKRSTFLSIITLISVVGVTLGVATLCVALSVMNGFQQELLERVIGINAHAMVTSRGSVFYDHAEIREKLVKVEGVKSATPIVLAEAMLSSGNRIVGVGIKGVDLSHPLHFEQLRQSQVPKTKGTLDELVPQKPGQLPGIAIGYALAQKLQVTVGDVINLVSPISFFGMGHSKQASSRSFRVSFLFKVGMHQYDSKFCFINITEAQKFFKLEKAANALEVLANHFTELPKVKRRIFDKFRDKYLNIRDWRQMNMNLFLAIQQNKLALGIVLLFIILVASLNIAGTLILMVLEKSKDIAILRAMGAKNNSIMTIFMTFGLYIGALGTMLGVTLGYMVCQVANRIGIKLDASVYFIAKLPIKINPVEWIVVAICALLISFLATIYPAIQASRQKPVEVLRYE